MGIVTREINIYVDGSFSDNICGAGVVAYYNGDDKDPVVYKYFSRDVRYIVSRNVGGELIAASKAVMNAYERGFRNIVINYDYEGIEKWANGLWRCNKEITKQYRDFIASMRKHMQIRFKHIEAHTGNIGNTLADQYAKEAIRDAK